MFVLQAKANNGEGPEILRSAQDGGTSGHAESLATTLAEHQQHLASFQVMHMHMFSMLFFLNVYDDLSYSSFNLILSDEQCFLTMIGGLLS